MTAAPPPPLAPRDARAITESIDEVAAVLWGVRARKRRSLFFKATDPSVLGVVVLVDTVVAYWLAGGPSWWIMLWLAVLLGAQGLMWAALAFMFGDRMPVDKEISNLLSLRLYDLNRMLHRLGFGGETHWNIQFHDVLSLAEELADLKTRVRAALGA